MKNYILLTVLFVLQISFSNLFAQFASGSGSITDPYIIQTADQLNAIRNIDWNAALVSKPYFKLNADIDLSGVVWVPINNVSPYCQINFDGNGHLIKNLSSSGTDYASLFGVLCGTCKNLGVINANVSSNTGAGIIAGYVGLKIPSSSAYTGDIENCFTSGTVVGVDAVGGISGNIGKPYLTTPSVVRNCYSTANVTATRINSAGARAGGVVGIIYLGGVLENSYATGTIAASNSFGAGGIVGYSEGSIITGCVAMNDSIINSVSGNLGRIAAFLAKNGTSQAQGINCWGYSGTILNNGGVITEANRNDTVSISMSPSDGITKPKNFLSNTSNFIDINWDFTSNNVWSQTMNNGYPMFQWQFLRGDYTTALNKQKVYNNKVYISNKRIYLNFENNIDEINIYSIDGKLQSTRQVNSTATSFDFDRQNGIYVLVLKSMGKQSSYKLIFK